ncbi:MAG TPA: SMI1/KNR4 family protein [Micromonosporaceae bacterium]|nr:SMI1/KNR4 family protein [Micromonosporaceae bacterium]
MDVDALVRLWSDTYGPPRPPRPPTDLEVFAAEANRRFGVELPADYRRFLTLTDGGQYDHALFYGAGPDDCALDRADDLHTGSVLPIGSSGNVDGYVLRPDGRAETVNFFGLTEVYESFPSFTALLAAVLAGRTGKGGADR